MFKVVSITNGIVSYTFKKQRGKHQADLVWRLAKQPIENVRSSEENS